MTRRRAFLLAGATFFVGLASGGACGYSLGSRHPEEPRLPAEGDKEPPTVESLPTTGDSNLDELRRLAVRAPIGELVQARVHFAASISDDYKEDPILWQGLSRLANEVLRSDAISDRKMFARWLAQIIEAGSPALAGPLKSLAQQLRAIK